MPSRLVTLVLLTGIFFSGAALVLKAQRWRLPGNQQEYEPEQPIAFSHRLHAGDLGIACAYCHSSAEKSRYAGLPASSVCMNCHKQITGPLGAKEVAPELAKLYDFCALNAKTMTPEPGKSPRPIPWVKIHNLPAHACFDHSAHVLASVSCTHCHGAVETMERVKQVSDLSMGWCVNCHRTVNAKGVAGKTVHASLDCATCHH